VLRQREIQAESAVSERLLALSVVYARRREHLEQCMSCTSGMSIAASRSSLDECMACPVLADITAGVEAEREYRARKAARLCRTRTQPDATSD
jgi:hypothetical protein